MLTGSGKQNNCDYETDYKIFGYNLRYIDIKIYFFQFLLYQNNNILFHYYKYILNKPYLKKNILLLLLIMLIPVVVNAYNFYLVENALCQSWRKAQGKL